jgi:hypothetical protein
MIAKLLINKLLTIFSFKYGAMILFLAGCSFYTIGQKGLYNASFEGIPQDAAMPDGWWSCDQASTPDILPGPYGIDHFPYHGNTYLGLITRQDGSWEGVEQRLQEPLKKDQCYSMGLFLARSKNYAGYTEPIRLSIKIGEDKCDYEQTIYLSPLIQHHTWKEYTFSFTPKSNCFYLQVIAFAETGDKNGHILIDNIGAFHKCQRAEIHQPSANNRL